MTNEQPIIDSNSDRIVLYGIYFSRNEIGLVGHASYRIDREAIQEVSILYGRRTANSIIQATMGVVTIVLGLLPVPFIVKWLAYGEPILEMYVIAVGFVPFGAWLVYQSVVRGFYIRVETTSGIKFLYFSGTPSNVEITDFAVAATSQFGYDVAVVTESGT